MILIRGPRQGAIPVIAALGEIAVRMGDASHQPTQIVLVGSREAARVDHGRKPVVSIVKVARRVRPRVGITGSRRRSMGLLQAASVIGEGFGAAADQTMREGLGGRGCK